jgi:hypothetical protein
MLGSLRPYQEWNPPSGWKVANVFPTAYYDYSLVLLVRVEAAHPYRGSTGTDDESD